MARKILLQGAKRTAVQVVHESTHDVESFIWVLSYCVMRNLCHRASQRFAPMEVRNQSHALKVRLRRAFGQTTTGFIAELRQSGSSALTFPEESDVNEITRSFMSDALVALFHDLRGLIHRHDDPFDPTALTHDSLLAVVNQRLASL